MIHINFKQIMMGLLTLATSLEVYAQSGAIPEGAYKGRFRGAMKGRVHLLTQSIKGCEGCFMAFLFKDTGDNQIEIYKALPLVLDSELTLSRGSQYTMVPVSVDPEDGELTSLNDNPSLVLNVTANPGSQFVEFNIIEAHSDNKKGFNSGMQFKGAIPQYDLNDEFIEGSFKHPGLFNRKLGAFNIMNQSVVDASRSATVTWFGDSANESGSYYLKEKAPGVFTFSPVSYLATGIKVSNPPHRLVVFINQWCGSRAFMVNPLNGKDVVEIKVKR